MSWGMLGFPKKKVIASEEELITEVSIMEKNEFEELLMMGNFTGFPKKKVIASEEEIITKVSIMEKNEFDELLITGNFTETGT